MVLSLSLSIVTEGKGGGDPAMPSSVSVHITLVCLPLDTIKPWTAVSQSDLKAAKEEADRWTWKQLLEGRGYVDEGTRKFISVQ